MGQRELEHPGQELLELPLVTEVVPGVEILVVARPVAVLAAGGAAPLLVALVLGMAGAVVADAVGRVGGVQTSRLAVHQAGQRVRIA